MMLARFFRPISRWLRPRRENEAATSLQVVVRKLEDLNATTESSFLHIGERLTRFLEALRELSRESTAVADLVASDEAARAASALHDVLNVSRDMQHRATSDVEHLKRIIARTHDVRKHLEMVKTAVRTFDVVVMMTRVESSRLERSSSDFGNMADEVKALAAEIDQQIEQMLNGADALRGQANLVVRELAELAAGQATNLPVIIASAVNGIDALTDHRRQAADASRLLAERFNDSSKRLSLVVGGLQIHDITRQKIEHVIQALQSAARDAKPRGALATLQAAQLREAGACFRSSVAEVRRSLESISNGARSMAADSRELLGGGNVQDQGSWFKDMEAGLSGVLQSLASCSDTDQALGAAGASVGKTVSQLIEFSGEIQGIGLRMLRVALNTSIRAVHIDERGLALGELADAISVLARDVAARSESLTTLLEAMDSRLDESAQSAPDSARLEPLRQSISALHRVQESAGERVLRITALSEAVAADVFNSLSDFESQSFVDGLETCADHLATIARSLSNDDVEASAELDQLQDLYTMDAERAVHANLASDSSTEPLTAPVAPADDDVELF